MTSRRMFRLWLAAATAGAVFAVAMPSGSRADEETYLKDKATFQSAAGNFATRLQTAETFLNTPSGLAAWVDDVTNLARKFDAASHDLQDMIYVDAARKYTSFCDTYRAQLDGLWGSRYGIGNLSSDYGSGVGALYEARNVLADAESKLVDKIAAAAANKAKVDPLLNDRLTALRAALVKLDALYGALIARNNTLMSNLSATQQALSKPNCGQPTPSPKKTPAPTPTPTPTPTPSVPRPDPTGADKWNGTFVSAGSPPMMTCGGDTKVPGADVRVRCVVKPVLGGGMTITIEGDFTLNCNLAPSTLIATCTATGSWHETNLDFTVHGTVGLRYDTTRHGMYQHWILYNDKTTRSVPGTQMYGSENQLLIAGGDPFLARQ